MGAGLRAGSADQTGRADARGAGGHGQEPGPPGAGRRRDPSVRRAPGAAGLMLRGTQACSGALRAARACSGLSRPAPA
nr:hypothetical protein [Kitasatospora sp. GP30]